MLAPRYLSGQDLPKGETKDEKKAVEMYDRACSSAAEACLALATLASQGKGGLAKDDKTVALYWAAGCSLAYRLDTDAAAMSAVGQSCAKIAAAEATGKGVAKDLTKAAEHYAQACARGDEGACDPAKKVASSGGH